MSRDNLVPLIREIGLKYKELNRKPAVDIRLVVEKEHMPIYFDKEIIQTILDNLISNALKYTEKGSISIGIRQVERAEVNYTEIRVSDTGYGIKPEALPHIFDRYYQEGGKHQASGTGIGLSLVKNLVALHEGEIRVESVPNQGSTFYVSLLTDNSYPQALHADSQEKESNAQHIEETQENEVSSSDKPILLVVEDNPDICDYIAESFSDHFEVKTAANGKLGKESALKEIPDIIVSDIMMPVMDGNEMCRELKKDVRTSHIPIILLTAKDSLSDKEEGYQMGYRLLPHQTVQRQLAAQPYRKPAPVTAQPGKAFQHQCRHKQQSSCHYGIAQQAGQRVYPQDKPTDRGTAIFGQNRHQLPLGQDVHEQLHALPQDESTYRTFHQRIRP